ncbi:MAG: hypothetical protein SVG88_05535 [Halobacteriales archaeon]|nr:hypothetical protein [Halobacteriales archaeon]
MTRSLGLFEELIQVGRARDVGFLLLPVIALVGLYRLSPAVKSTLTFSHITPSVLTAFTTHYIHYSQQHLTANLTVYLLLVPTVYSLTVLAGRRRLFFAVFWTFLLVFPVVLSASSILVLRQGELFGFSGIALSFAGFLPVTTTRYLGRRYPGPIDIDTAPSLFFLGLAVVALLTLPAGRLRQSLVVVPGIIGLLYLWYPIRRLLRSRRGSFLKDTDRVGAIELVVFSVIAYFVILVVSFRTTMVNEMTIVNLYLHFLGFSIGFLASYLTFRIDRRYGD